MDKDKRIAKAALIIAERVMDEFPADEHDTDDVQLFTEILCHLLEENPEECEQLIGTVFCEEEELE